MRQNYTSCQNSSNTVGDYDLRTYTKIINGADIVLNSVHHSGGVDLMPQEETKLSSNLVDKFDY